MPEKLGIDEIKTVVGAGLAVAELVDALADGVGISDIKPLIKVGLMVKPAVAAVKTGKLMPELKDLDDAEKADLKKFVQDNFSLKEADIESKIKTAIDTVIDLTDLLQVV